MKKLAKKNIKDILQLTPMQEGMLFHYLKNPASNQYFEQLCLDIAGQTDIHCFEKAWNFVIDSNELLRTVFRWEELEHPIQIILKEHKLQPGYCDLTGKDSSQKKKRLDEIKIKDRDEIFDLQEIPFKVSLCKVEADKYMMIISNHHILYDGWSTGIILKEFFNAYNALAKGKKWLKPFKTSFKEFVKWIQYQDIHKQEKFWRGYLKGFDTKTGIPVRKRGVKTKSEVIEGGGNFPVIFSRELKEKLETFVKTYQITLASVLYSAWGILLQKYNNIKDVIFGTTISGRSARIRGIEDMVGLFINTLPLRIYTDPTEKIINLLQRTDQALQMREAAEHTPLVNIKEWCEMENQEELFDTIMVIENYPLIPGQLQQNSKLSVDSCAIFEISSYDLTVSVLMVDDIKVNFNYNRELFDTDEILRLSRHFICILEENILENPGSKAAEISIITKVEKDEILYRFNNTGREYPKNKTIHRLFQEQAERTPDNTAIVGPLTVKYRTYMTNKTYITYRELNEKSGGLACLLQEKGVGYDTIVGIMSKRSPEMITGILGILKAGGAYLPIDADYPEERIKYMLADSAAKILLTTRDHANKTKFEKEIIYLVDATNPSPASPHSHLSRRYAPAASLAYIIYTSGSTGKPKGVLVEHRNVERLVTKTNYIDWEEGDKLLLTGAIGFDITTFEIWGPLLNGLTLFLADLDIILDAKKMAGVLTRNKISILHLIPQLLNQLAEDDPGIFKSLTYLLVGGDVVRPYYINKVRKRNKKLKILNMYGPTENTTFSTFFPVDKDQEERIPIGKPIGNSSVYILDKYGQLQPIGLVGELCTGGIGVARGYVNNPELTAERFKRAVISHSSLVIGNPGRTVNGHLSLVISSSSKTSDRFSKLITNDQCPMTNDRSFKLYHTGDLAQWLPDGNIEFLGRDDYQVKIRGFRIELGEIENRLLNYHSIKEAVVIDRIKNTKIPGGKKEEKYLCAYIVTLENRAFEKMSAVRELKEYLSHTLPNYMIPSYFIPLEKIPLTSNGKVDRKSLPESGLNVYGDQKYTAPQDQIEKKLAELWSDILGIKEEKIGIDSNFFELGGHSLKVTLLVSKIHKEFNVKISIAKVFETPFIRQLANYIRGAEKEKFTAVKPVEEKEYYELSPSQKRMYVLNQFLDYSMPILLQIEGCPDRNCLQGVFQKMIKRHECLRTSIEMIAGDPFQKIHEYGDMNFKIEYYELAVEEKRTQETINPGGEAFFRPFDLSYPPLLRVGVIRLSETRHIFLMNLHHIISDGLSLGVLIKEFRLLYRGAELPELEIRYRDFTAYQQQMLRGDEYNKQESYWLDLFSDEIPILDIPTDYPRPAVQGFEGNRICFAVEGEDFRALKALALAEDTGIFMVLLAVYNTLLFRYTAQEDLIIGTITAGRDQREVENLVGVFINPLALRNYPAQHKTFNRFLRELKHNTLKAYENRLYPFGDLLEKVIKKKDVSRSPLFDVMIIFMNMGMEMVNFEVEGLRFLPYKADREHNGKSQHDITLWAEEEAERIVIDLEYCTGLFKQETMERFARHFINLLKEVMKNPLEKLPCFEIMAEEEKRLLLEQFNETETPFPGEKSLQRLFEEQVERTPDHIAVIGPASPRPGHRLPGFLSVTYKKLKQRSAQLAGLLVAKGVRADTVVGIMADRSVEMIIGITAVLEAEGAYLPLDPNYPGNRIAYMAADSNVKILLISPGVEALKNIKTGGEIIDIDAGTKQCPVPPLSPAPSTFSRLRPADLAYVIYTSGSTGKPKGVMVQQGNVVNAALGWQKDYRLQEIEVNLLQMASFSFDVFAGDFTRALINGGKLVICPEDTKVDLQSLYSLIRKQRITLFESTPALVTTFMEYVYKNKLIIDNLKLLIIGSDSCRAGDFQELVSRFGHQMRIINSYGVTEATIDSSYYEEPLENIPMSGHVPIGKPMPNMQLYIEDFTGNLQPIGVPGELCIGGAGVARGYLNNPGLTNSKFQIPNPKQIPNKEETFPPHSPHLPHLPYSPIYKTGDLARWLPEGNVEFLGRMDSQVKIRGYRVELKEIENRLMMHNNIKQAVVLARGKNDKYLCAYIIPLERKEDNFTFTVTELKEYLAGELPAYMIPAHFISIDKIPLNENGKINVKALSEYDREGDMGIGVQYVPPATELEKRVAEMWSEILMEEKIGLYDNFFDLGGQSIKAMKLMWMIKEKFHVKISLTAFFRLNTVKGISQLIIDSQQIEEKGEEAQDHSFANIKFEKKKRREIEI